MKKLVLSLFILCMLTVVAFAQDRTITGKVTSREDGLPIPGATVKVKDIPNVGITTGSDGKYSLKVPSGAKELQFVFVGYATETRTIGTATTINVALDVDAKMLESVVVTGYGSGRKITSQVGSVATVSGKTVEDKPLANPLDALQGKVAGLQVYTSSGEPSQMSSIRLHGVGSLGASSTPLFLLDGVPVDQGTIISLNPNDIENMSILKDASSTSIYGSRAANGVFYVTTKRGSLGKAPEIRLSTQYGVSNLANEDFFKTFMNRKELSDYFVQIGYQTRAQMDAVLAQYPSDTEWYKTYYQKDRPLYQADLSITGGGGKTTYYISAGYINQEGLAYRSGFDRTTLRSNLNTQVNDWFSLGLNLSIGTDNRKSNPFNSNDTNRGLAMLAPPWFSPNNPVTGDRYDFIPGWGRYHPEYRADKQPDDGNNVQFNPSGYIQINPIKNLTIKAQAGLDAYDYRRTNVSYPSYQGRITAQGVQNGFTFEYFDRGVTRTVTNTIEYKFNIATKNHFTVLAGQESIDNTTKGFQGSSSGQTDDRLVLIGNGPNERNASSYKNEYSYQSYFGRAEYDYNNKYFLDLSVRRDASSRFGVNNRNATFWSVGGMWRAKQEDFLKDVKWLSDLTVRASTGTSGNSAIGNYQSQALIGSNQYDAVNGFGLNTAGNPILAWEKQQKTTIGVKTTFLDRIRLDVEFYNRVTKDMLIDVPYPLTTGFSTITSNIGSLYNRGIDVTFDVDVWRNDAKRGYLTPYINLNYNTNKITELFQGRAFYNNSGTGVNWAVGQAVNYLYPIFYRVNPANGLPEWYKPNADPNKVIENRQDPNDVTSSFVTAALQQNTGIERYPKWTGGFGLSGGYMGITVQADFSFAAGKYLINNDRYFFENPQQFPGFNQNRAVMDYWKQPGDNARFPKLGQLFTQFDSRLIENASFIRMKTLTVGYNLPQSILKPTKAIKGAKFFFQGRNLLTFTDYTGPDPEVDSNLSLGANPNTKQYAFGVELRF